MILISGDLITSRASLIKMRVVYFTSKTGNTARFAGKLRLNSTALIKGLTLTEPFVLFVPTYASRDGKGSVAKPIITFLNDITNRQNLAAIVGFGNRNFGENFAIGSEVVSLKCNVPLLHKVELFGNSDDIEIVEDRIREL